MFRKATLIAFTLLAVARGQQIGTQTAETHPKLQWSTCTASGCQTVQGSIVLDANWRWLHTTTGYTNCYTGASWDATLCPDATTCAANCALDGADYAGTYGITTSGNALTLAFKTGTNVGSRVYLMDSSDAKYELFNLLNQEFTFDVDVSKLPCGLNGAVYFSEMAADGGSSAHPTNKAGAKYGTGYCDSQCPRDLKFINGAANVAGWNSTSANSGTGNFGSCCSEMDIWEANSMSAAVTPHPCSSTGLHECTEGVDCTTTCDQAGCDFNSFRMGNTAFYGKGDTIDTSQKITVVTQFITNDGTNTGTLSEIRRVYVQNGKVIQNSQSTIPGVTGNSITESFCAAQKTAFDDTNTFDSYGGLKTLGQAMGPAPRGGVLVLSIWDDYAVNMLWLDSDYPTTLAASNPGVARGSCATTSGAPADVEANGGSISVTYSNIKFGTLNSTYTGTAVTPTGPTTPVGPTTVPPTGPTTTPTNPTTVAPPTATQTQYGQCGGNGYTGPTVCASGTTCKAISPPYYSQCL